MIFKVAWPGNRLSDYCRRLRRSTQHPLIGSSDNTFQQPENLAPPFHNPVVPMSVKSPFVASTLYIETSSEPEFVT
jgi:hypothetical protein